MPLREAQNFIFKGRHGHSPQEPLCAEGKTRGSQHSPEVSLGEEGPAVRPLGGQGEDPVRTRLDLRCTGGQKLCWEGLWGHKGLAGSSPKAFPCVWEMRSWLLGGWSAHSEGGGGEERARLPGRGTARVPTRSTVLNSELIGQPG